MFLEYNFVSFTQHFYLFMVTFGMGLPFTPSKVVNRRMPKCYSINFLQQGNWKNLFILIRPEVHHNTHLLSVLSHEIRQNEIQTYNPNFRDDSPHSHSPVL